MTECDFTYFNFEKTMLGSIWRPGIEVAGKRGEKKIKKCVLLLQLTQLLAGKLFCNNHKYSSKMFATSFRK